METYTKSDKAAIEQSVEMSRVLHEKRLEWLKWLESTAVTLLVSLLGLAISAESLFAFISLRRNYAWLLAGILGFQTIFIIVIWANRKKNRRIVRVKEDLIRIYVSAISRSRLNPNLKSSES